MDHTIKRLGWKWDPNARTLHALAELSDGTSASIAIPLSHVSAIFDEELGNVPEIGTGKNAECCLRW